VINCAGASNVDLCETDRDYATRGNYQTSLILARAAAKFGSRLIQISTDYIFDGDSGPFSENDPPSPINFYGRSKLMAEKAVVESNPANTIVRVCSLYSKDLSARPNPFNSIVNSLKNGSPYSAVDDLYSNPTEVSDLAAAICQFAQIDKLPRLLHLAPTLYQSRFEFATQVAELLSLDKSLIKRVSLADLNLKANRPRKAGLKSTLAPQILKKPLLSLSDLLSK
jgi:dTDP-4-dehydrorhamnose reductase